MLRMMKRLFARAEKRELAVILIEVSILLLLLIWAITAPVQKLYIGCEDFYAAGIGDAIYDGSTITLKDAPAQRIGVWGYRIKGGAYEVSIKYRAGTEDNKNDLETVAVFNMETKWPIKFSEIQMKNQQTTATGRLWVPMSADCRDLNASVWYRGLGWLELESISITEKCIYRYVLVSGAALLFFIFDLLYAFFLCARTVMTEKKKVFLALSGVTFAASILFIADFITWGHDLFFHLDRIVLLGEELKYGQFPVRMFTTANNYYGYPVPIFYCDLFLYLPALLYNCMVPLQTCYQIYIIVMNAATCAIAYYCFFKITKLRKLSILGTALYTLCTVRLMHFTVRAAVGEYSAMTFLPLILLGMHEIYSKDKQKWEGWLPLSLGMTGIICSHMVTTELIVVDLVIFALALYPKTLKTDRLAAIVKAAVLCVLLCAWFIVPFLDYYFTTEMIIGNRTYFLQKHGTYLIQMLGVFMTGDGSSKYNSMVQDMPLTIGFSLTLGIVITLICIINQEKWKIREAKSYSVWRMYFLIAILNMVLTLQCFPWDVIQMRLGTEAGQIGQILGSIQFPWRWLTPISVLLVFCVIIALSVLRRNDSQIYMYSCAALIIALTVGTGYYYHQYSSISNPQRLYSRHVDEYMDDLYLLSGTDANAYLRSGVIVEEGDAQIEGYHKEAGVSYLAVANHTNESAQVTLPIYGYRHYHAVDGAGQELPIRMGKNDLVSFDVAPGYSGEITVRFVPPVYWRIAEVVSLLTVIALCCGGIRHGCKARKKSAYSA